MERDKAQFEKNAYRKGMKMLTKNKYTEFEKKMVPIAKRKCEKIYNLGGTKFNQYVYKGETYFGIMELYEYLTENDVIKRFSEQLIDEYYGI